MCGIGDNECADGTAAPLKVCECDLATGLFDCWEPDCPSRIEQLKPDLMSPKPPASRSDITTIDAAPFVCPSTMPEEGSACPEDGLSCPMEPPCSECLGDTICGSKSAECGLSEGSLTWRPLMAIPDCAAEPVEAEEVVEVQAVTLQICPLTLPDEFSPCNFDGLTCVM